MAEIELSVLSWQCLDRRIPDAATLTREVAAWQQARNADPRPVNWRFTAADARIKLKRLYPSMQDGWSTRDKVEKRRLATLHKFVAKRFRFTMIFAIQQFKFIDQKLRTGNEPYKKNQGST